MMKTMLLALLVNLTLGFLDDDGLLAEQLWDKYKRVYDKEYQTEVHERTRFEIFKSNIEMIKQHNNEYSMGMHTYTLGVNEFVDWTFDEFKEKMLGLNLNETEFTEESLFTFAKLPEEVQAPAAIDWRTKNVVTRVKNQGACGSCWAFASTSTIESAVIRKSGRRVTLSEQQLVDCSSNAQYGNKGCKGGWMNNAYRYIKEKGGIQSDRVYPYVGAQNQCRFDKRKAIVRLSGFADVEKNEDALRDAVATVGPISVAITVTDKFMYYKGGVFVDETCNGKVVNHAVVVVGYTENAWIVKNSWGNWGNKGYINMARNRNNMCKIASFGSYPLVR